MPSKEEESKNDLRLEGSTSVFKPVISRWWCSIVAVQSFDRRSQRKILALTHPLKSVLLPLLPLLLLAVPSPPPPPWQILHIHPS